MFKLLIKLLGVPKGKGTSGKREVAVLFALFTMGLLIWAWPRLSDDAIVSVMSWLISATVALLAVAFGMESLITQAGFKFSGDDTRQSKRPGRPETTYDDDGLGD